MLHEEQNVVCCIMFANIAGVEMIKDTLFLQDLEPNSREGFCGRQPFAVKIIHGVQRCVSWDPKYIHRVHNSTGLVSFSYGR
jgi:hypothetical protein